MGRRRGNREGNIRKRSKRRADGSIYVWWEGSIMVGRRADGKPDRRVVVGATREEVAAKLAELVTKKTRGELVPADRITLGAYLDAWFAHHKNFGGPDGNGLRPATARNYEGLIKHHIKPRIGHLPLQKVGPDDLKRLYQAMLTEPGPKGRPVGIRMAEMAHNMLHKAFADAVLEGKLPSNPCDRVASPPRTRYRAADRPVLDKEEAAKVLEAVRDTRYYLPFLLAMATGMRRNEILGLTWDCVDLEAGIIHVRQQWNKRKDGSWGLVPPKTEAGVRDVPIPAEVVDALAAHKVTQEAQGLGSLVFDRGDGKPILPADVTHAWIRVRKDLGLPANLRLHDLRGAYLTWLAERGVDPKTMAQLAGHADVKVTAEIYQRVTVRMLKKAARAVEGLTGSKPKRVRAKRQQ